MVFVEASTHNNGTLKLITFCLIIGGVTLYRGLRKFLTKRKVEDLALSKITSAAQGLIEIEGQAWPTALRKCIDGRPVCFWSVQVQEYRSSGKNSKWETVYTFETSDDFLALDDTGACLIQPLSAQLEISETIIPKNKMSELQLSFLSDSLPLAARYFQGGGGIFGSLFENNVRLIEKKILAGAPIYARGHFYTTTEHTHAVAIGDINSYKNQIKKVTSANYQKVMFDSNRDGKISEEELRSGHSAAANMFMRRDDVQSIKIAGKITSASEHGLIIADIYQKYLIARMSLSSLVQIWGGVAALGIGFYFLSLYLTHQLS
ncbi:MAG: hypothetical protein ACKOX6_13770 [Bdellovibrio sp.]